MPTDAQLDTALWFFMKKVMVQSLNPKLQLPFELFLKKMTKLNAFQYVWV